MVSKYLVSFKNGMSRTIETDIDLVKAHAMHRTGVDFDAPPVTPYDGLGEPSTLRDQPYELKGVCFVGGYFSMDLCEVAYVEKVGGDDDDNDGDGDND